MSAVEEYIYFKLIPIVLSVWLRDKGLYIKPQDFEDVCSELYMMYRCEKVFNSIDKTNMPLLFSMFYIRSAKAIKKLNEKVIEFQPSGYPYNKELVKPDDRTAIQLVSGFNSFGIHSMLSILDNFPWVYKNFIFVGVAAVDSGSFRNHEELVAYEENVKKALKQYVEYARKLGMPADYRFSAGTDVVELATELCINTAKEFPKSTVFAGKLTFQEERFYHKMLHNDTAFMIQKNLQQYGVTTVILPVTVALDE